MSEYNELYQAVQPESPQVVPDEVRFVYIPKAQKGVAGLAWFNEEHFDVSGDSEVSLSATVLGNIDKKLDKVTESPTGHGRVYAIYGDGREDPQTMWDLDDTGIYSGYHIPSSDGRGYLKVKDPVDARNPVNKQFLDEKLKGKLDDLGKTSGVFPAAYVRQQGLVSGHDYGKSIEVHGTPDAYTIPVRDAYGALTSASPKSPNDVVTLEYAESHYLKTQPYTNGDGLHSLIFNEIYTNFAFSRDSNVFGENSMVGLWGVKYTAIDTTENSLTIGTISSSPFNAGDRLNIVNDKKYDRSCTFVKYENGKVYVDKLPFSAIVEGDTGFDAYTISSEDNPSLSGHYKDGTSNIIDLGKYAFSAGGHNKALNYATFLGGVYNKAYGEYGTAFGRDNEVGYCGFAAGRGNVCYGQYGTIPGGSENKVNTSWGFAAGRTNSINGMYAGSFGRNNSAGAYGYYFTNDGSGKDILLYSDSGCTKPADCEYVVGDTLSAGIGARYINAVTITAISGNKVTTSARLDLSGYADHQRFLYCEQKPGVGATSITSLQTALGLQNTVLGEKGVGIGAYNVVPSQYGVALGYNNRAGYSGVSIGTNNKTNKEYCILIGNNNTSSVDLTTLIGHGLTSNTTHQSVFGKYNDVSSTDPFVFGYGTAEARKNLASIGPNGELRLAGNSVTLNYGASNEETLNSKDFADFNALTKYSYVNGRFWLWTGRFTTAALVADRATVKGDLTVGGNFTVTGTTTVKDVKNLAVEDLTITLGKDNLDPLQTMAGIIVPNYAGESAGYTGGIVFDNNGIGYIGDVQVNSNGTVSRGDAKMIMASTMDEDHPGTQNGILAWDVDTKTAYSSDITTDKILQKLTSTSSGYNLYAFKGNDQTSLAVAEAGTAYSVPRRTSSGAVRGATEAGTDDSYVNVAAMLERLSKKVDRVTPTDYTLYGTSPNGQVQYLVRQTATAGAIPRYLDNGKLQVRAGTEDVHAVNLKQMNDYAVPIQTTAGTPNLYNVTGTPFVYGHINSAGTETETTIGLAYDESSISSLEGSFKIPVMDQDGMLRSAGVVGTFPEAGGKVLPNCDNVNSIVSSAQEKLVLTYLKLPSNKTGTNGQILVASGYEDCVDNSTGESTQYSVLNWADPPKAVKHWVATLANASDPDVNGGQVEFWSTGTPNSETNPTNFNDLFAKRVGKALVRGIDSSSYEYFVYMLGYAGATGVVYYTAYPFTESNTSGVMYDSVTLTELT